ncbi:hypothetical protein EB093_08955 [bacterium]|nr:hypothetical protein [bacterium]
MKGGAGWTKNGDTFPGSDMVKDPPGGYYAIKYAGPKTSAHGTTKCYKVKYNTFDEIPIGSYFIEANGTNIEYNHCNVIKPDDRLEFENTHRVSDHGTYSPPQLRKRTSSSHSPSPASRKMHSSHKGGRSRKSTKKSGRKSRRNTQ